MRDTVQVRVILFASHRETFGESRVELPVSPGTDLESLYAELVKRVPAMAALRSFTTFALNRQVVAPSTVLADGDEVALLQPVSGGCND